MNRIVIATGMGKVFNQSGMRTQSEAFAAALSRSYEVHWYGQEHVYDDSVSALHVFSQDPSLYALVAGFKRMGTRIIVSPNNWVRFPRWFERSLSKLNTRNTSFLINTRNTARQIYAAADLVTCNTVQEGELLRQVYDVPEHRLLLVHNGIYPNRYVGTPSLFRETHPDISTPFFVTVGQVGSLRKNHLRLFEAWQAEFPDLVVIGQIDDTAYARQCIEVSTRKQNIRLLGFMRNQSPEFVSALHAAECLISPGSVETPGIAALEAMACGTPVITTSVGGTDEYFGNYARYVDTSSVNELTNVVSDYLDNPIKTEGIAGYARTHFDWKVTTQPLLEAYRGLFATRD